MAGASARILIVEDEGALALHLRRMLERMGYEVQATTRRGVDAIDRARELAPDLVLMDILLEGEMDGVAAAARIRQTTDVPVIFLTSNADLAMQERTHATQPYGYVLKPFDDRQLQIAIEGALYRHEIERRLRKSERWLTATLRSLDEAVIATDAEWRIRFISRAAEALTGWSADDAMDRELAQVLRVASEDGATAPADEQIGGGGTLRGLLLPRHGHPLAVEERSTLIRDEAGAVVGIVISLRRLGDAGRPRPDA